MNIIIVNGNPRKGNIYAAVQTIADAAGVKNTVAIQVNSGY